MNRYLRHTHTAFYGIVAALPLLVAYELLLLADRTVGVVQMRNAADVWLRLLLASLGVQPHQATLAMIFVLLLAIPVVYRREVPLRAGYLALVVVEAAVYSLVLGVVIQGILRLLLAPMLGALTALPWGTALPLDAALPLQSAAVNGGGVSQRLALSLGAGLFEEFVFRVVLLSLLLAVARAIFAGWLAATVAIFGAAFLFALAHHIGPLGDPLTVPIFLYRWIAGLLFTVLYYSRGFAVVAYAHALYDIRILLF